MTGLMSGAPPFPPERLVTLANWQDPPYNRWAFQHVRELIPTARIWRGNGPVWELPRRERDLSGIVGDLLARTYTDGFLVIHRGQIVTEQYFNGLTPDAPHLLMSVSKSITSTVAGALGLDVTARVERFVPELGGTCFAGATVQDLLDMRAGVQYREDYDDPTAEIADSDRVYLWRPADGKPGPADALSYFGTLRGDGPHGGPFRYQSILADVLAWVIERAGQARFADLVSRELWQPMGAESDAEVTLDRHGNALADGGICATLRDTGRFGLLALLRGRDVVPSAWFDDVIAGAPDGAEAFAAGDGAWTDVPGAHYRNFWWVIEPATALYYATGIHGQHVFVHVPAELVVVKLSSWPEALSGRLLLKTIACVKAIAAFVS
jgi:CubicO group peptidase (beta-lactamase class C family)